jgi:hypothetical protein
VGEATTRADTASTRHNGRMTVVTGYSSPPAAAIGVLNYRPRPHDERRIVAADPSLGCDDE